MSGVAESLATRLGLDYLKTPELEGAGRYQYFLRLDDQGLALHATGANAPGPIRCDFVGGAARHRRLYGGGRSQAIARATGLRVRNALSIADLTAGMGEDAFTLASLGARVTLVERHSLVHLLLQDGLRRAADAGRIDAEMAAIVARLQLFNADGRQWLEQVPTDQLPDVIYLDPMFPERRKSARVKKSMATFQQLVGTDSDAGELLLVSLEKARFRVVVKRPAKAPFLADRPPGYSQEGKTVRFDIYPLRAIAGGT